MRTLLSISFLLWITTVDAQHQQDSSIFTATGDNSYAWKTPTQIKGLLNLLNITGTWHDSSRTNIYNAIGLKQPTLVSGTNIKTVNGTTILGSGNLVVTGGATRVFLPSDVVNNNASANTIADCTGLLIPLSANITYKFKVFVVYASAATTTGSRCCISFPATTFVSYYSNYTLTATSITNNQGLASANVPAASNASSLASGNIAIIEGIIRPSAGGSLQVRFASEISASAITAIGGRSYIEYEIIN